MLIMDVETCLTSIFLSFEVCSKSFSDTTNLANKQHLKWSHKALV
jgi:hypothetical protein